MTLEEAQERAEKLADEVHQAEVKWREMNAAASRQFQRWVWLQEEFAEARQDLWKAKRERG